MGNVPTSLSPDRAFCNPFLYMTGASFFLPLRGSGRALVAGLLPEQTALLSLHPAWRSRMGHWPWPPVRLEAGAGIGHSTRLGFSRAQLFVENCWG